MPTNLLLWNVQFFSLNKINLANSVEVELINSEGKKVSYTHAMMNLTYILNNLLYQPGGQGPPHIFVLIENLSSQGTKGSLAGGDGAAGAQVLLSGIRNVTQNKDWMIVPPLKLTDKVQIERDPDNSDLIALLKEGAYTECISVFYRSDLLEFVGPYVWPEAGGHNATKTAQPNTGQATGPYPDEWRGTYPADNHFAGQFEYFTDAERTKEILFPDEHARRPFFTQFREKQDKKRLISLVSVHYPPDSEAAATAYARTLDRFGNGTYKIDDNEVILVGGDINLDYCSDAPLIRDAVFNLPKLYGFTALLNKEYGPTMLKRAANSTLDNYLGKAGLDNIAVRAGSGLTSLRFLPCVYDRVNRTNPSMMFIAPAALEKMVSPEPRDTVFRLPQNYGHLGPAPGVSDHLPVYLSF